MTDDRKPMDEGRPLRWDEISKQYHHTRTQKLLNTEHLK